MRMQKMALVAVLLISLVSAEAPESTATPFMALLRAQHNATCHGLIAVLGIAFVAIGLYLRFGTKTEHRRGAVFIAIGVLLLFAIPAGLISTCSESGSVVSFIQKRCECYGLNINWLFHQFGGGFDVCIGLCTNCICSQYGQQVPCP